MRTCVRENVKLKRNCFYCLSGLTFFMENDKFKIIKGRTHWLLTVRSYKKRHNIDAYSLNNWRLGNKGDWVLSDDNPPMVVQVLGTGTIESKSGKKQKYIRTVCGSYMTEGKKKMYGQIAESIYTFSGIDGYKKFLERKDLNTREVMFASYIALGEDSVDSYLKSYKTEDRKYASSRAGQLLRTERVQKMVKEELKQILEEEGVSANWIVEKFKQVADLADRDTDVLRSLESLAKMSGMFDTGAEKQQLTVWGGFSPEQLDSVKDEQLVAHGESEN